MTDIGVFSPNNARRVWNATREVEKQFELFPSDIAQRNDIVLFRNRNRTTVPAFGLMQVVEFNIEDNRPIFVVDQPIVIPDPPLTSYPQAIFLVNGRDPVPQRQRGAAQRGPVFKVAIPSGLVVGDRLGWGTNSYTAALGCLLVYLGPDEAGTGRCMACSASVQGVAAGTITSSTAGNVTVTSQSGAHTAFALAGTIVSGTNVTLIPGRYGRWLALPPSDSDTLETFQMTSNWLGGIATATFVNLSEPLFGSSAGILEDPEGIFVDVLGAGGRGLSIRTRYGRHYVIQAKCAQTLTTPASTGACDVYISGVGTSCIVTTEAACTAVGGTYGGNGTTCP